MPIDQFRISSSTPLETEAPLDWTLALAGGDGMRLADYVERRFGARIPKQYCTLYGDRTMLQHTLDRTATTPPSRTLAVIGTQHAALALPQLLGRCDHVFRQPLSRDTGTAIYVALAMIARYQPNAIVTITPTDHYVDPPERYADQVRRARNVAARSRDLVVVVGAQPNEPDPELGYLALGAAIADIPLVRRVRGFVEKPTVTHAVELNAQGALWNTMVTCGSIEALFAVAREAQPRLVEIVEALIPLIGSPDEDDALDYIYRTQPNVSFSKDILEHAPDRLAAIALEDVEWSDWGRAERIETTLHLRKQRAELPGLAARDLARRDSMQEELRD